MNMSEYAEREHIYVEVVKDRGAQIQDGWEHHAYKLRLRGPRLPGGPEWVTPVFDWRQGYGIETTPHDMPGEVLDSLVSDAMAYLEAMDFEDFARNFGYDTDSRKAEAIYRTCGEVADWLDDFLAGELEDVAYTVDRL